MTCFGYFTCEIAAVARRACPVGRGVEGGRREKMRWFRPPFQCGREDSARETQERSWSGFREMLSEGDLFLNMETTRMLRT